jgi:RNA recognition motif-containing protein
MGDRGRARSNSRDRRDSGRDSGRERRDDRDGGGRGGDKDGGATTSLLVRNLSYRVTADEIRRVFTRYGDIRDVYIPQVTKLGVSPRMYCKHSF